jgi:hypothetical protein
LAMARRCPQQSLSRNYRWRRDRAPLDQITQAAINPWPHRSIS